ncbi:MAG TPA: RdgB/HAM1 family non-canonical purine NTP pyrophosphatase [Terriglobales bacterium]|nr:RdgB/HAM1 family non-canonical purine NTP pyrophosphatase [Terriglobales bacterium]
MRGRVITVATSNAGKLRDFQGAAAEFGVEVRGLPRFASLPPAVEDGLTFAENARKKAAHYAAFENCDLLIADDSGIEVDALGGAPGVHSARYAATANSNAGDAANNAKLLRELSGTPAERRGAQFVCVIAAAAQGAVIPEVFTGTVRGMVLQEARGGFGFGYDPLFLVPELQKTFAELSAAEKARFSHRGIAFRKFLEWLARTR